MIGIFRNDIGIDLKKVEIEISPTITHLCESRDRAIKRLESRVQEAKIIFGISEYVRVRSEFMQITIENIEFLVEYDNIEDLWIAIKGDDYPGFLSRIYSFVEEIMRAENEFFYNVEDLFPTEDTFLKEYIFEGPYGKGAILEYMGKAVVGTFFVPFEVNKNLIFEFRL